MGYCTGRWPLALVAGPFAPGAGACGLVEVSTVHLRGPWSLACTDLLDVGTDGEFDAVHANLALVRIGDPHQGNAAQNHASP